MRKFAHAAPASTCCSLGQMRNDNRPKPARRNSTHMMIKNGNRRPGIDLVTAVSKLTSHNAKGPEEARLALAVDV